MHPDLLPAECFDLPQSLQGLLWRPRLHAEDHDLMQPPPRTRMAGASAPAEISPFLPVCDLRRLAVASSTREQRLEAARRPRVAHRAAINCKRQFTNGKLLRSRHAFLVLPRTAHAGGRRSRENRARASFGCRGSGQLRYRLRTWRPWLPL
jgi:hypothetical protein